MTGDLRSALRRLARAPAFTAIAIATLALAVGGSTAVFSVVDAVLLKALPFEDPDRVVKILLRDTDFQYVPQQVLDVWRTRSATLEAISGYGLRSGQLREAIEPARLSGEVVGASFFDVVGVRPLHGRAFRADEESADAQPVMVLSHGAWQGPLRGDPEILGKSLLIDDTAYTVVGIAPPGFHGPWEREHKDFWTPYPDPETRQIWQRMGYTVFARLRDGVTLEQARRELSALAAAEPGSPSEVEIRSIYDMIAGGSRGELSVLMAAVLAVLLIGCLNLAQLQLARAERQTGEFAARKALGASAWRLFRQALTESLTLAVVGGVLGIVLAYWLVPLFVASSPSDHARLDQAAVDLRALGCALFLAVSSGCLFGSAPAWRLARTSVAEALKGRGGSTRSAMRRQTALLALQVCATLALLSTAGLLGRRMLDTIPRNTGFEPDGVSFAVIGLNDARYDDRDRRRSIFASARAGAEAIPGAERVAMADTLPYYWAGSSFNLTFEGERKSVPRRWVSPDYFALMQIPLVSGELFQATASPEGPVDVIVTEGLARKLAPEGRALGMTLSMEETFGDGARVGRIVGVAADTRAWAPEPQVRDEIYLPFEAGTMRRALIVARAGRLAPSELTQALRLRAQEAVQDLAIEHAYPLTDLLDRPVKEPRFRAYLVGSFSLFALLLAAIGIFGSVAYCLSTRRKELAVRAAVGASSAALARAALSSAATALAIGLLGGVAATYAAGRAVASQMHRMIAFDPWLLVLAAGVLVASAAAAALLPARRAARIDPIEALRQD
ncbi:MAG: ABC transporter permease [Bryobacterales bacterium]|nr:ABC transporter permease [Bryobacterales bacterium]